MKAGLARKPILTLVLVFAASVLFAADINRLPPDNWSVPSWGAAKVGGAGTMAAITNPVAFQGLAPCRIADTRLAPGPYGAPSLIAGAQRNFTLFGQCGIPTSAVAVSLNLTITGAAGPGIILIYPAGGSQPLVSTLNYVAGETLANAAIVPLGAGGAVTVVAGVSNTDFLMDTNGFFYDGQTVPLDPGRIFQIIGNNAGGSIVYGENQSTSAGSRGVRGIASATTGAVFGVLGETNSVTASAAGVLGNDGSGRVAANSLFFGAAGVRGESNAHLGVLGITTSSAGFVGTAGFLMNTAGTAVAAGYLGSNFGTALDATGPPWGVFALGNLGASGAKHFVEPHPTDPNGVILYSSLEGREVGTYFRGTARTVGGVATIQVPEDFRIVTDDEGLTTQLTPVGSAATMYIVSEDLNTIVVRSSRDVRFHYLIQGVRRAFKDFQPIAKSYEFMPLSGDDRMPAYLTEEARRRLITNGTYNPDGTVNMSTAESAGWTKIWADRQAASEAAARGAAQQKAQPGFDKP